MPRSAPPPSSPARSRGPLLLRFLLASGLGGVLVAALVAPAAVAAGAATNAGIDSFQSLPASFTDTELPQTSTIRYADGTVMARFAYEDRTDVPLSAVAPVMRQAVVAIEDARFYEHGGVDPRGIARALVNDASGGQTQGASTLTQQWIKNVQADRAVAALPPDATLEERQQAYAQATQNSGLGGVLRKVREIRLAIAVSDTTSKDRVLEGYLNAVSFGDGAYGVEAASQHYFGLPASQLDLPRAALLAGLVQDPVQLDPTDHPEASQARRDVVLDRMLDLGEIDRAAHDAAVAVPVADLLRVQSSSEGCATAGAAAPFCDAARRSLLADPRLGATEDEREQRLERGGLTITTTLDPAREQAAQESLLATVPADAPSAAGVLVSVEPGTGAVVALAQSRPYSTAQDAPEGSTAYDLAVDTAQGGYAGFQTGSAYKPFTLATWLASGRKLSDVVVAPDTPTYDQARDFPSCQRLAGTYTVRNSEGDETGPMSVLDATANSVNTAYTEMARQLDLCGIRATAAALGVHPGDGGELSALPSTVLGTNTVSPETMAAAYAAFASSGTWCVPYTVDRVTDASGAVLVQGEPECHRALDAGVADAVTVALGQVLARGTAAGNGIDWPAAGKTGTTNDEVGDTWFVGYTRQLSTAVYVGTPFTDAVPLTDLQIGGHSGKVFGATFAAPIWRAYMQRAMAGLPQEQFPPAPPALVGP